MKNGPANPFPPSMEVQNCYKYFSVKYVPKCQIALKTICLEFSSFI